MCGRQVSFITITVSACFQPASVIMVYSSYTNTKVWLLKGKSKDLAPPLIQGNNLERSSSLSTYKLNELG